MEASIFTRIIKGELPSYKIYEDDRAFAFLDIHPIHEGQVLVVPKKQVDFIWDLSEADYDGVMRVVRKVGRAIRMAYPHKARVGVMVEGLDVANHAHVKVFPFSSAQEFRAIPDHASEPDAAELRRIQSLITKEL